MKKDIEAAFGSSLSQEIDIVLSGMSNSLKENFGQLRSRLDEMEQNIIKAIQHKENQQIVQLKQQLEAKERRILELTMKGNQDDGKDGAIKKLNETIRNLQVQVDQFKNIKSSESDYTLKKLN